MFKSDGAVASFERSIEERKLLYKTYIGDGDSKAHSAVVIACLIGRRVYKQRRAHTTKRMGPGLRTLVKNYKVAYCILAYRFPLRINGLVSMSYQLLLLLFFFHLFRF